MGTLKRETFTTNLVKKASREVLKDSRVDKVSILILPTLKIFSEVSLEMPLVVAEEVTQPSLLVEEVDLDALDLAVWEVWEECRSVISMIWAVLVAVLNLEKTHHVLLQCH